MPTANDHFILAKHNLYALNHLSSDKQNSDWVTTTAAYTALHLLEALLFAKDNENIRIKHSPDHGTREDVFKASYPAIWKKYRPLLDASKVARYLKIEGDAGQTYRGYYPSVTVYETLFKGYLGGVIRQVKNILGDNPHLKAIEAAFDLCVRSLDKNYT
jgi:hypothetical protein